MSVTLHPSTSLGFNRPLTRNVKRSLYIINPNSDPVAFKVKTTAQELYGVRPNVGKVDPGEMVEIQVMLYAMKGEPPLNSKCKDKFRIQSMLIPPEKAIIPLRDLWTTPEGEEPGKVHVQKVKVNYLPPEGHLPDEQDEFSNWITLQPGNSLGFNRPLTQNVTRSLNITNSNADPVSFKVKIFAPIHLYCVRPNFGRVDPGETVEIQVILQAMKEEPPLNSKCKDKFLIQSMLIPPEKATIPLRDLWTTPEATGKVRSQKVKVDYLPPEGEEYTQ